MKRLSGLVLTLTIVFAGVPELSALDGNKAVYAGGTITLFNSSHARVEGRVDLTDPHALVFVAGDLLQRRSSLRIPYSTIQDLEFRQKVRRRLATAVGSTALLGPIGALAFTAKKRQHYLTVVYTDERGLNQVAVLELGKDIVRSTLVAVETRSGTTVEYQDEHARNWR
jgi:hypothetical protein